MNKISNSNFWDRYARIYNKFMQKDKKAYEQMYVLLRPIVNSKNVLEVATGTALIANNIAKYAKQVEAIDSSEQMIRIAQKDNRNANLHFSVADMFNLPYISNSFDVVIVANALHVVPQPEKALSEIKRVLKDDGILVAPTFTHADNRTKSKARLAIMKILGFPLKSKWSNDEYLTFLEQNGWIVNKNIIINASFPLSYVECSPKDKKR